MLDRAVFSLQLVEEIERINACIHSMNGRAAYVWEKWGLHTDSRCRHRLAFVRPTCALARNAIGYSFIGDSAG